ncbi:MAG: MinD/ParA family protein [Syntrophomonadaceae bacterium]|mgnify:CR=1 FL=1|nr:MinD/ParA family protein [Syntrophomonadaceae bacterium]
MKKIKLLLADDNEYTRTSIRQLLELDDAVDIVDEACNGLEVMEKVEALNPEIVLMDVNMPIMDGIETTRELTIKYPQVAVVLISINDEIQNFRQAMLAGAKEYLVKPLSAEELNQAIRQVTEIIREASDNQQVEVPPSLNRAENHKIVTVFGTKGGVGKSVVCTNLAVCAAQKYRGKVGLIDLDVQFGDLSIMMNVNPRMTIAELMQEGEKPSPDILENYLYERNGVHLLSAPNKPELSELVVARGVKEILNISRSMFTYTFVDTPSFVDEITLTALEEADIILLMISLDLPTIKNVKKGIDILRTLQLLSRTRLILNRSSGIAGLEPRDVERVLDMKIKAEVPSDGKLVVSSLNQGIPFVKMNPKAAVSKGIEAVFQVIENGRDV